MSKLLQKIKNWSKNKEEKKVTNEWSQEMDMFGCRTYDENNNIIHYEPSKKIIRQWREYDEKGIIIIPKSYGSEYWQEFDENNNLIHYKNSDGFESWREYNKNNKLIYYKDTDGKKYRLKWDEQGFIITKEI